MLKLFGGSVELKVDRELIDCSTLRPIPDNQEVFLTKTDKECLIVELLECINDKDPIDFYLKDLQEQGDLLNVELLLSCTGQTQGFKLYKNIDLLVYLGFKRIESCDVFIQFFTFTKLDFDGMLNSLKICNKNLFSEI